MVDYLNGMLSEEIVQPDYFNGELVQGIAADYFNGELVGGMSPVPGPVRNVVVRMTSRENGIFFRSTWDLPEYGTPDEIRIEQEYIHNGASVVRRNTIRGELQEITVFGPLTSTTTWIRISAKFSGIFYPVTVLAADFS